MSRYSAASERMCDEFDAGLRRSAACVRACAGISDPETAVPALVEACRAVLRMRIVCPEDAASAVDMCRAALLAAGVGQ